MLQGPCHYAVRDVEGVSEGRRCNVQTVQHDPGHGPVLVVRSSDGPPFVCHEVECARQESPQTPLSSPGGEGPLATLPGSSERRFAETFAEIQATVVTEQRLRAQFLGYFDDKDGFTHGVYQITIQGGGLELVKYITNTNMRTCTLSIPSADDPAVEFMKRESLIATSRTDLPSRGEFPRTAESLELSLP